MTVERMQLQDSGTSLPPMTVPAFRVLVLCFDRASFITQPGYAIRIGLRGVEQVAKHTNSKDA